MATGVVTSYDLTVGVIVNMDEAIYLYDADDLPLLTGVGADGMSVLASAPVDQVEFSWLDEQRLTPRSQLAAAATTAETAFTVQTNDGLKFSTFDIVMVRKAGGNEIARITGISSDTLTVSRGLSGTATNYASGAEIIGLGTALAEGSAPQNFRAQDTTKRTNCTQIFGPSQIQMSGTDRVIPRYGIPDQWAHQLRLRQFESAVAMEQAYLYGAYYNSTTTKIRTTGGLRHFISTNIDSTSTQLTVTAVQSLLQKCYNRGGLPDRLIANPVAMADLNDITNTSVVRVTDVDSQRGRVRAAFLETEYGSLPLVRNRYVAGTDAFLVKRDGAKRRRLRPMQFKMLGTTGDFDQGIFVCEEGLQVKGEKHMAMLNSMSYNAGLL